MPLIQGRDSPLAILADHQIPFPRAWTTAICCRFWPVVDADHPDDPPTGAFTQRLHRFTLRSLGLEQVPDFGSSPLGRA